MAYRGRPSPFSAGHVSGEYSAGVNQQARTRGGVSFQCEKRFSDFRAFHAEWLEPVMSLGSPLPIPSANPVDKNSEDTVESRKRGLTEYLREAVALCDRLGSPAVTAALQRFLQPGNGGGIMVKSCASSGTSSAGSQPS